ncbi:glycosyltransferase [Photobacterium gaetbulicola]|nr:glycosyltransferase [Photobacterium gaetbulicola]
MNILIYTKHWRKGGIEKLIAYLIEHSDNRYNFTILTEDVPDPKNQYELPINVRIYFRRYSPFTDKNKNNLRSAIKNIDPDVIVVMGSTREIYKISRASIGLPYPIVISEHNSNKEIAKNFYNDYDFYNAVRNAADLNHVIFSSFAEDYPNKDKVRVVTNPILPLDYRASVSEPGATKKKIIHIARYDLNQKQQDILVRSFSLIAQKHLDWELHLYGGDWFGGQQEIKNLVSKLDLSNQVFVHDAIENVGEVLSTGSIFAFPSAYEGFGLVVGEAMSVGLPVVAFADCEGVNQIVKNGYNGTLVSSSLRDCDMFSQALDNLMSDEEKRKEYSINALKTISDFSLEKFISGWEEIFDEAFSLKGKNKLLNLSDIEQHYMDVVVSGLLFDKIYSRTPKKIIFNKVRSIIHKLRLQKLARYIYRKFKK